VGEAQVQNLVIMFLQGLHLHTRDGVVESLELIVPGDSRGAGQNRTWVPRHIPGHAVVAVEKLLPQEFVAGHGAPLLADEPHREHVGVIQVQKDLEQDGVWEPGAARVHRVILPPAGLAHRHMATLRTLLLLGLLFTTRGQRAAQRRRPPPPQSALEKVAAQEGLNLHQVRGWAEGSVGIR
uniref:Complement C8 gamma chain n=1 Tax=Catharus ustulatus TaxID=91951 RepID=A0A8C3V726_CATUS